MKVKKLYLFFVLLCCLVLMCGCKKKTTVLNSNETKSDDETKIENIYPNFNYGCYGISENSNMLNEDTYMGDFDENIEFFTDNTFAAYLGWGNAASGTFNISNDIITCEINDFWSEYSPHQETSAKILFKIIDANNIQIIDASETYIIHIVDIISKTLTSETKKMTLFPFIKNIDFIFIE